MRRRPDWLLNQLPMGMLDDEFFVRFISLFQEVATTLLDGVDNIPNVVDLTVAPPALVRWLGSWLAVTSIDASLPEELQRRLVRQAGRSLAWRGTRRGLESLLGALTEAPAEIEDSGGVRREVAGAVASTAGEGDATATPQATRKVTIRVQSLGWLSEPDFVELVADELPANVAWELYLGERRLWPQPVAAALAAGAEVPA